MKAVDLFAGCGGLSKGFENAGFNILAAFEYWDKAYECYKLNFKHDVYRVDLSDVDDVVPIIKKYSPDIIIGGPPCQDFSHAGKRVEGDRANLTQSFALIIKEVRPAWFLMENVDRIEKSLSYAVARDILKTSGYGLTETVLDASRCGVPQKRKRFICIGKLGEEDAFLFPFINKRMSEKEMTLRDYFGDGLGIEYYYRHPRNYSRRAVFSIDEPSPTIRGVNRPIPSTYVGHPNDAAPISENVRPLTTIERAMIQTFPADYKWYGSKTDIEQMIGNAVPVKLAEFVASAIKEYAANEACNIKIDFESLLKWLVQSKGLKKTSAKDVVSRIKRANKILAMPPELNDFYIYQLQQQSEFETLSTSIKSQIRRAVGFLLEYPTAN